MFQILLDNPLLSGAFVIIGLIGLTLGWLIGRLRSSRYIATLETRLEYEAQTAEEKIASMQDSFAALSGKALRQNNQQFMQLAQQTLQTVTEKAELTLKLREQAMENMVKPIQDSLTQAEKQFQKFDQDRRHVHSELSTQLKAMSANQHALEQEARKLVKALSRPEVRGRWGEINLKRIVELAGMTNHCDFVEQPVSRTEQGTIVPDMIIHLPGNRQIIIDVKTPIDAYLNAISTEHEDERRQLLERHATQVKARVRELSSKKYWSQFTHSPDFVVLYIPGDQFLSSALEVLPDLLEYALQLKIIIATPSSLIALLRTIAYGWRQEQLNSHALEIRETAEQFHQHLARFSQHFTAFGKHLHKTADFYNQSVRSFEKNVMPIARKFSDLGIRRDKEVVQPEAIESQANQSER